MRDFLNKPVFTVKNLMLLILSVFMFLLTTVVLVFTSRLQFQSMDLDQKVSMVLIVCAGYLTSALYMYIYVDNRKAAQSDN